MSGMGKVALYLYGTCILSTFKLNPCLIWWGHLRWLIGMDWFW